MATTAVGRYDLPPEGLSEVYVSTIDDLRQSISYAAGQATSANPYTVRLAPGTYITNSQINMTGSQNIRIVGAGMESTKIIGTATWVAAASAGTTASGLLNLTGSGNIVLQNLTIDGGYENRPAATEVQISPSGLLLDQLVGDITIIGCHIKGLTNAIFSGNANSGIAIRCFSSKFLALLQTIVSASEDWFFHGCNIGAIRASTDTTTDVSTKMCLALNPGASSSIGSMYVNGCEVEAVYTGAPSGDPGFIGAVRIGGSALANGRLYVTGGTMRVTMLSQPTMAADCGCLLIPGAGETGWFAQFSGVTFITETGALSLAPTSARVGVVVTSEIGGSFDTTNILEFAGCTHRDIGSGGRQRGAFVTLLPGIGTIRQEGWHSPLGPLLTSAETASGGTDQNFTRGTATLSSGIKRILLITDVGNKTGTATFSSSSTAVTGVGTAFTTQFRVGDFIRRSDGTDSQWTRINTITDDTNIVLEENYRGSSGSATVRLGTPTSDTPFAGTAAVAANYRVLVTPTAAPGAAELFYVTSKHASGFTINSSDGASTKTLDYLVVR